MIEYQKRFSNCIHNCKYWCTLTIMNIIKSKQNEQTAAKQAKRNLKVANKIVAAFDNIIFTYAVENGEKLIENDVVFIEGLNLHLGKVATVCLAIDVYIVLMRDCLDVVF